LQFWIAVFITLASAAALWFLDHKVAAGIVLGTGFTVVMGVIVLWEEYRPRRRTSR
jgi:hypothetical protein